LLIETCREWNADLYMALVDFEKAFDTVEHSALWTVLQECGVPEHYVVVLQRLYEKQTAVVSLDEESGPFELKRGVKQGDPVSALLFILVMDHCMQSLKEKWANASVHRKGLPFGMRVDGGESLTNLRFADDILLVASSKGDVGKMLRQLAQEASKYGLKLHMGKTKVLTTCHLPSYKRKIEVNGEVVEVLQPDEAEKYLGCKLCMEDMSTIELESRIADAWGAFAMYREQLCSRTHSARTRMKLFEAVVTPTVLYGSATWALTRELEGMLRTAQRTICESTL